jgi:hypothetical protein
MQDQFEINEAEEAVKIGGMPFSKSAVLVMEDGAALWLEGLKNAALDSIKRRHGELLLKLLGDPTIEERDTWKSQQAWAEAYISNQDAAAAVNLARLLTEAERKALGKNAAQTMAEKIMGKVVQSDTLISIAAGVRREAEKAIEASGSEDELTAAIAASEAHVAAALQAVLGAE